MLSADKIKTNDLYSLVVGFTIFFLCLGGVLNVSGRNFFPATLIFELLIFFLLIFFSYRININAAPFVLILFLYIFLSFLYSVSFKGANFFDFLLIYKSFFYLFVLSFFAGKIKISTSTIKLIFNVLLASFLIKYFLSRTFGFSLRPDVFAENNFELMMIALVAYLYYLAVGQFSKTQLLGLLFVFLISGSRSGLLIFFFFVLMIYVRSFSFKNLLILLFLAVVMTPVAAFVFFERLGSKGLEGVDRYVFLLMFINDVSDWSWHNYLFGGPRITPMSDFVCESLSFYKNLFSYEDQYKCYSNVLHSYLLRVVFDHGLIGFLFVLFYLKKLLNLSGVFGRHVLVLLGIPLINSMSVSAFNSIYFAFPYVLILTSGKREAFQKLK